MQFSNYLFWDTDRTALDIFQHSIYIIDRVIGFGTWEDWRKLLDMYGHNKVKDTVIRLRYLDSKTLSFLSLYFNLPQKAFRCYTFKQSNQVRYPF
jgi:hypothetical protein